MKENPSYHEWVKDGMQGKHLYDPLYKKPWESWDNFGREPTVMDGVRQLGQLTLDIIKYILIDKHQ